MGKTRQLQIVCVKVFFSILLSICMLSSRGHPPTHCYGYLAASATTARLPAFIYDYHSLLPHRCWHAASLHVQNLCFRLCWFCLVYDDFGKENFILWEFIMQILYKACSLPIELYVLVTLHQINVMHVHLKRDELCWNR